MKHRIDIQNTLEPDSSGYDSGNDATNSVATGNIATSNIATNDDLSYLPTNDQLENWANSALSGLKNVSDMTIRIVDESEIQSLNNTYRHKNTLTNVLSFPAEIPEEVELPLIGDIVICAVVVEKEAKEQHKSVESHWAHMIIHGTLHLLGYDHLNDEDATEMESKEIEILNHFGYSNPYYLIEEEIFKKQ